jgi:hypothetical protein
MPLAKRLLSTKTRIVAAVRVWVEHLRESGYKVKTIDSEDMAAVKKHLGVPDKLASCHTGVVDASGQVVEGHVPAAVMGILGLSAARTVIAQARAELKVDAMHSKPMAIELR